MRPPEKPSKEQLKQFLLEELQKKGITKAHCGTSIHELDYEDLMSELVLVTLMEIDVAADANKWF